MTDFLVQKFVCKTKQSYLTKKYSCVVKYAIQASIIFTGFTGTLKKVTFDISNGASCGVSSAGAAKINIQQKTNGNYYCRAPLPDCSASDTGVTLEWLGHCRNIDIDVGREYIKVWIFAEEIVCINSLKLEFSTETGQKVFFWGTTGKNRYWYSHPYDKTEPIIFSLRNQSRKFKIFGIETRKTEGPRAYSRYKGRSARTKWPTFLPS